MSESNVGANLVFALRTTFVCEPMSEENVSNSFSNIGLISVFVRRANIRFAPTLVLLISLILVFVRGEHKVRPIKRITKYLLRSTRKFMTAYLLKLPRCVCVDYNQQSSNISGVIWKEKRGPYWTTRALINKNGGKLNDWGHILIISFNLA